MVKLIAIAVAGGLGTLSRHGANELAQRHFGDSSHWGTFIINVVGCLLFGVITSVIDDKQLIPHEYKVFILTGFLGAFTTFSTFQYESVDLMTSQQWVWAGVNLLGQIVLGIAAVVAGLSIGKIIG